MATPLRGANGVKPGRMPEGGNLIVKLDNNVPPPPNSLKATGQVRWIEISTILLRRGVWSNDWVPALEHLCREYDNLAVIDTAMLQPDQFMLVPSTNGRTLKTNPLMDYRLKIEAFIQSQLAAFGLTPASSKGIFTQDSQLQQKPGVTVRSKSAPVFN